MLCNFDDDTLMPWDKDNKVLISMILMDFIIPLGSTEVVQNDSGPWMHGTVVKDASKEKSSTSYKINVTKTVQMITRTSHHVKQMPTSKEQYLHDDVIRAKNQPQHDNDFDRKVSAYSVAYADASHRKTCAQRLISENADSTKHKSR